MSYLHYLYLFGWSLPPVVCRMAHVLFTLSVFVYVICICLRYLYLFGCSLPPVVCRMAHVLFTLSVFVWFVFTSSCL